MSKEWIAQKGSFVPPRAVRNLRDLTRHRAQLAAEKTRVANRIHKSLQDANIKLSAVATDVLGKSGRAMLRTRPKTRLTGTLCVGTRRLLKHRPTHRRIFGAVAQTDQGHPDRFDRAATSALRSRGRRARCSGRG